MNLILKSFTLLLVFAVNFSYAQKNRFDVGIEGGPNLSTILNEESTNNYQLSILGSAGTFFQYNCKKTISFKTGLFYQQKGYQWKQDQIDLDDSSIGKGKFTSHLDYLTLPLLTKITFGKKINFFVNAGPYIGFLLQKTEQLKTSNPSNSYKYQDMQGTNRFDFGLTGGLGLGIPIKEKWLITIEARNYSGIMNIATNGTKLHTNTTDFNIGFAYKMGLRNPINETNDVSSKKDKPQIDIGIEGGPI
ncbi:porin family protein [Fluviicola sp.]|uniref:porin family protein n=1 Tax=Fluviicola sp. TaxID=1917219 RepID=UPI003D271267